MTRLYLKQLIYWCFFLASGYSFGQVSFDRQKVHPFEDYSQCKVGFVNAKGDTLFPAIFENLKKIQAISLRGRELVDYERDWAWIVSENNQFGCLSELGTWIIPCKYEQLEFNSKFGMFIAKLGGKYGALSLKNEVSIPFEFDAILTDWKMSRDFMEFIPVSKDKKMGLYGLFQNKIVSPVYDSIGFMKYLDDQPGWIKGVHFEIYSGNKVGVSSRGVEELITPKYKKIEYFEAAHSDVNPVYFLVTDEQNKQAVFDEKGKQLTSFVTGKVSPVYDQSDSWEKPLEFVEFEDSSRMRYMISLSTGKTTQGYLRKGLFDNCIYVQTHTEWKVLNYNFRELYTHDNSHSFLWFHQSGFPTWLEEKPSERHFNNLPPEDWNPKKASLPMVALLRSDSIGPEEQAERINAPEGSLMKKYYAYGSDNVMHYALFSLETKKVTSFSYMELRKFQYKDEVYYWAFHDFEGTQRTSRKIDVYNDKGKMVRQIDAFNSVDYIGGNSNPVLCAKSDEQFMLYNIAGNQLSSIVHDSYPHVLVYVDKHFGVIAQQNEEEGTVQFTDLDKKPLLDDRKYTGYDILYDPDYNIRTIVLEQGENLNTILSDKFEVLLDSCSIYSPWNNDLNDVSEDAYLLTKGLKAYILENGKVSVLDKKYFHDEAESAHIRSGSRYFEIDRFGNIIPEPPAPEQLVIKHYGSIFLTETKEGLKVENANHEFVQLIENFEKYDTHKGLLQITLNNGEQGVLSMKTGNWIFNPGDMEIYAFRNRPGNWYWVNYGTDESKQWRLIDSASNLITNQVFDEPFTFYKGQHWTVFKMKGLYGTIDSNLTVITKPTYSYNTILMGGKTILYVDNAFSLVDAATGKAFRLERSLVNWIYPNGHLLFFNDSIQVLANDGRKLTKAMSINRAIEELDLNKLLNGKTTLAENGATDPVRRKIDNHILIETARKNIVRLYVNNNLIYPSFPYQESGINPILISKNYYVEELKGYCYKPHLPTDSWKQKYGFNNYRIENDSLILLNLPDLFKPNSGYEQVLDSLIEKEIQRHQFFGTTCVDMPGAVREFKRNFYFNNETLSLVHYPTSSTIRFSFKQLEGFLKNQEDFK